MTELTLPPMPSPRILIIDDDPFVLPLLRAVCEHRGFGVWTASGGAEGIEEFTRHRGDFDLVLLDVRMPGMDGPATFEELREFDPGVTCCFMSGHMPNHTPEDLLTLGAVRFFEKPFRVNELAEELWALATRQQKQSA